MAMYQPVNSTVARLLLVVLAVALLTGWTGWFKKDKNADAIAGAQELSWENLIPTDYVPPQNPLAEMSMDELDKLFDGSEESNKQLEEINEIMSYAPIVEELDGEIVSIPGYVVPLESDNPKTIREFLLVPYMGACIHTPPPPANQLVYAKSDEKIKFEGLYKPVVITGRMSTETIVSDLAESGYRMEVMSVKPFKF